MQSKPNGDPDDSPQLAGTRDETISLAYARPGEKPSTDLADWSILCALGGALDFLALVMLFDTAGLAAGATLGAALGLLAVFLGIRALRRIRQDPCKYAGGWLARVGIALGGLTAALITLLVTVVFPLQERAYTEARIAASYANLRSIGIALCDYAALHSIHPSNLQTLATLQALDARELRDPARGDPTSTCDYYYITGLKRDDPADWIVAYSDPAYYDGEGGCILRLDGTVDWVREPLFSRELQRFRQAYQQARGEPPTILPPDPAKPR